MNGKKGSKSVTKSADERKSRAKYQSSPALNRLIALVNAVPPDVELPHYSRLFNEGTGRAKQITAMKELLRDVPDWFIKDDVMATYISYRSLRRVVHEMAQIAYIKAEMPPEMQAQYRQAVVRKKEDWDEFQRKLKYRLWREWSPQDEHEVPAYWRWPRITLELAIGADGTIEPPDFDPLSALFRIEAARLRECPKCWRIFWARQDNIKACNSRCNNALNLRSFRAQKGRK